MNHMTTNPSCTQAKEKTQSAAATFLFVEKE
jgi:hypothetical protein